MSGRRALRILLSLGVSNLLLVSASASWAQTTDGGATPPTDASLQANAANQPGSDGDILVTARRQAESSLTVPESISAFGEKTLTRLNIQSFNDYATKVPNVGFSYGTGGYGFSGSRTIAIRGISGAGTTATYIDDTPIPESVDPQVADIQRIEVLKGPRGTLYGQGSLGGNIRFITNRPSVKDNDLKFMAEGGFTKNGGSADYMVTGIGNIVLAPDRIGLRVVGFTKHTAGFYEREYPSAAGSARPPTIRDGDQGASTIYGGSASLRFVLTDELTANVRLMGQSSRVNGYPALDAPLPAFRPVSLVQVFGSDIQETAKDDWFLPSLELSYENEFVTITSSTSFFKRNNGTVEDGTISDNQFLRLIGLQNPDGSPLQYTIPNRWFSDVTDKTFNQEVRASFAGNDWIHGVVGARYGHTHSATTLDSNNLPGLAASGAYTSDVFWIFDGTATDEDKSIFGEAYLTYSNFELTLGLRQYWLKQRSQNQSEGFLVGGINRVPSLTAKSSGLNPKIALSYKLPGEGLLYASASKGFRAGRTNPPILESCLASLPPGLTASDLASVAPDSVWNYEVGAKARLGRATITGTVFQMDWNNIQQNITLPVCNLTTGTNAGAARSRGLELEMSGQVTDGLNLRLAFGYNDAKITKVGLSQQVAGDRVYQVPKITGSAAADYDWQLTDAVRGFVGGDVSYTGNSVSNVAPGKPVRPSYTIVNARLGVRRGALEVGLYARNLLDSRANLGDLTNLAFGKTDATGAILPRTVILQPRQLGVSVKYGF